MKILIRFAKWWVGMATLFASLGTCPCCGGLPCARGVVILGFVSALLFVYGMAFVFGLALTQGAISLLVGLCLVHWKRKFTHQATYGGMNWPRAVQIASLGCAVLGGLYAAQGFNP